MEKGTIILPTFLVKLPAKKVKTMNSLDHSRLLNIGDQVKILNEKRRGGENYFQVKTSENTIAWVPTKDVFKWECIKITEPNGVSFNTVKEDNTPTRKQMPEETIFYITAPYKTKPFQYQVEDVKGNKGKILANVKHVPHSKGNALVQTLWIMTAIPACIFIAFNLPSGSRVPIIAIFIPVVIAFVVLIFAGAIIKEIVHQIKIRM